VPADAQSREFVLIITTLVVSLGAPFWFDLVNKLVNLRHAGNVPPKAEQQARTSTVELNLHGCPDEGWKAPATAGAPHCCCGLCDLHRGR
jgi:hypothetical protein